MDFKKYSIAITVEDEDDAAALYMAISHYLDIKAKDKKIVGVPLCDLYLGKLEKIRNDLYQYGVINQVRALELNDEHYHNQPPRYRDTNLNTIDIEDEIERRKQANDVK